MTVLQDMQQQLGEVKQELNEVKHEVLERSKVKGAWGMWFK